MRRSQWLVLAAGAVLLMANALFPSRNYADQAKPGQRAWVFSEDFYREEVYWHVQAEGKAAELHSRSHNYILAYDRFLMTSIALSALTLLGIAVIGVFSSSRREG